MDQKRRHTRVNAQLNIELEFNGKKYSGTTVNISQGGALLRSEYVPNFDSKILLHIEIPGTREPSEIPSVVRWSQGNEIGIQFETLRPIEVWAIGKLLRNNS